MCIRDRFNNQQKLLLSFRSLPEVLFPKWDRGYMRAVSAQSRFVQADFVLCHGALPPLPPGSQAHLCTATRYSDVQAPTPLFPATFVFVLSQLLFRKCVYERVCNYKCVHTLHSVNKYDCVTMSVCVVSVCVILCSLCAVSYTHLTLPTILSV